MAQVDLNLVTISEDMVFSAPPSKTIKRRSKKHATPVVESSVKRCTRSLAKKDGFRAGNLFELASPPKNKRPRAKPLALAQQQRTTNEAHQEIPEAQQSDTSIPPTPIRVIQQIGVDLEIEEGLLTKDKLEAGPSAATSSMDSHDL